MQKIVNKFPELGIDELIELFSDMEFPKGSTLAMVALRYGEMLTSEGLYVPMIAGNDNPQAAIVNGHQNLFDRPYTLVKLGTDSVRDLTLGAQVLLSPFSAQVVYGMYRRGYSMKIVFDHDILVEVDPIKYKELNTDNVKVELPSPAEASAIIAGTIKPQA